jgi:hypothetical protein
MEQEYMMTTQIWGILIPEATTNYVLNPRLYTDDTGWTAHSTGSPTGTRGRNSGWSHLSGFSYKVDKTAGTGEYGVTLATSGGISPPTVVAGEYITFSAWVKIEASSNLKIDLTPGGASNPTGTLTKAGPFEGRVEVTAGPMVSTVTSIDVDMYIPSAETGTFYIDAAQVEAKAYKTTYCDGRVDNCQWIQALDYSRSTRLATVRAGGREFTFDEVDVYVSDASGAGFPPLKHYTQGLALLDGMLYRGQKALPTIIRLLLGVDGASLENLHSLRKALLDYIKPDAVPGEAPLRLSYDGGGDRLWIDVQYDGGFDATNFTGFVDAIPLRFIAYDPFWYEEGMQAVHLTGYSDLTLYRIAAFENDAWNNMDGGLTQASATNNTGAYCIVEGPDGKIYVGGDFDQAGGVTNTARIAVWDPDDGSWAALGTGAPSGRVYNIVFMPDGTMYAVGSFPSMGGVSNTQCIAKWNGSVWSSVSSGVTGAGPTIHCAYVRPTDGSLAVGGDITAINGVTVSGIAFYDGTTWTRHATTPHGDLGRTHSMLWTPDGKFYVGGYFSTVGDGTITANGICWWDTVTGRWQPMEGGASGSTTEDMIIGPDGYLYACSGGYGGDTENNPVSRWNNASWETLDGGSSTSSAKALAFDKFGQLWVAGLFSNQGSDNVNNSFVLFNGTRWGQMDLEIAASGWDLLLLEEKSRRYIGFLNNSSVAVQGSYSNTFTFNGTRESYPIITIRRTGGDDYTIKTMRNAKTGATLRMDYTILDGEELVINLIPGRRSVTSNLFGPRWDAIKQLSNVHAFSILPGANNIEILAEKGATVSMEFFIEVERRHWSFDGGAA